MQSQLVFQEKNEIKRSYVDSEIVQLHSAVSKEIGSYHMMEGQNPVTVITIQGKL